MDKIKDPSFEIFINALSVGWHLRKIMEADENLIKDKEMYDYFIYWLERHNIKTDKNVNK